MEGAVTPIRGAGPPLVITRAVLSSRSHSFKKTCLKPAPKIKDSNKFIAIRLSIMAARHQGPVCKHPPGRNPLFITH